MAEFSGFWTTSGAPAGHQQASYTQAQWSTASMILSACSGFEGVAPGYLNQLAGTVTGANTVAINTGGAMVDGKFYNNSASLDVNIPSAVGGGNTRIDRIVVRCTWADFHAEITRIAGTDAGSPTAPAITQTTGTTYDIMLYQALVDTGGTVTLTDERVWACAPIIRNRQGGSATIWSTYGTTNYVPVNSRTQAGSALCMDGTVITFPVPFTYAPIVFCQAYGTGNHTCGITVSATAVTITVYEANTGSVVGAPHQINWLAIGPIA